MPNAMDGAPHTYTAVLEEPQAQRAREGLVWPQVGDTLNLKRSLSLKHLLHHACEPHIELRVFLAEVVEEGPHHGALREIWVTDRQQAEALLKRRTALVNDWRELSPALAPPNPSAFERLGSWACLIIPVKPGEPLTFPDFSSPDVSPQRSPRMPRWMKRELDALPDSPTDDDVISLNTEESALKVASLIEALNPLLDTLEVLHKRGRALGGFHPEHFTVHQDQAHPLWPMPLLSKVDHLEGVHLKAPDVRCHLGYAPPEAYGHYQGKLDERSDVFSVGMHLFYALTGLSPLEETRHPTRRLPSVRVYHPSVSPELEAVVRKAISPVPSRRYPNAVMLRDALRWAAHMSLSRAQAKHQTLHVEVGHELHVGLLKGQYNPTNQDDLFLGYDAELSRGLFVVTDGVSISEHGSGDIASGYVRQASSQAWESITRLGTLPEEGETLSELSLAALQTSYTLSSELITDLLNNANRCIGEHVTEDGAFYGPPENIMAATAVIALIDDDRALLASMGDSRIYLVRDGHIASLMVDDDLATHLMQLGQTPSQATQAPSSAALVNCVGEFKKSAEGALVPVPVHPQLSALRLLPGDTLVLCSDGIPDYGGLDEEDAEVHVLKLVEAAFSAPKAAFDLITLANQGGGGDNLSCIVLRLYAQGETSQ